MISSRYDFVIFDVETTGIDPRQGHEIVEIAAERLSNGQVTGTFHAMLKPRRPMDPEASAVNGITDDMLVLDGKPDSEVIPAFMTFAENAVLVGHNVMFDAGFLNAHLVRLGRPALTNQLIDTIDLAKRLLIIPSYSLQRVAAYLKIPVSTAHRAQADVETTRQIFLKLLERQLGKG